MITPTPCCESFKLATSDGTDGEMSEPLIRRIENGWSVGFELPLMNFCPWCGRPLMEKPKARYFQSAASGVVWRFRNGMADLRAPDGKEWIPSVMMAEDMLADEEITALEGEI